MIGLVYVLVSLLRLLNEFKRQQAEYRRVCEKTDGENHEHSSQTDKFFGLLFHLSHRLGLFLRKQREKFCHILHLDAQVVDSTSRFHAVQDVDDSAMHDY